MVSKLTIEYFGAGVYHRVVGGKGQGSHQAVVAVPWSDLNAMVSPKGTFMQTNRRAFFASLLGVGSFTAVLRAFPAWLSSSQKLNPPPPGQKPEDPREERPLEHKPDPHALLKENQKSIKRDVERLAELAAELKQEVDKTDSADVLSIPLLKKAEEIEKLAKAIRNHARG
jgi:hypothetical protein